MTNLTNSHTDSKGGENDRSEIAILEDMCEQGSINGIILDGEGRIDENEVVVDHTENETKSNYFENTIKYDPSRDLPIALRKGTRSCTKHSISNYVSYENLSPQFRAFTTSLDSTVIPKNTHIALEFLEWKNVVMKEMRALEKKKTCEITLYLRDIKLWDANGCSLSNRRQMEPLTMFQMVDLPCLITRS